MVIKMDIDNQILENFLNIYSGILANNQKFVTEKETIDIITDDIIYEFDLKEFVELKEKYNLEYIAEGKSDFERAVSLLMYFSPKLTHSSWYDNHIECNALRLLEYSFGRVKRLLCRYVYVDILYGNLCYIVISRVCFILLVGGVILINYGVART